MGGTFVARVRKKFLKAELQLVYELMNKVILPREENRIVDSIIDLFMIQCLSRFKLISLPALIIEHMYKVVHVKEGRHEIPYGYFMNKVFNYFGVFGEKETPRTAK